MDAGPRRAWRWTPDAVFSVIAATRVPGGKHAYRETDPGGYSVAMPTDASETLFSVPNILWFVVSAIAAILLLGSINRRRTRLTQSLRDYVDQNQESGGVVSSLDEAPKD